jgi:hypothetical protein
MTTATTMSAAAWLTDHSDGATPGEALEFFDSLPAVTLDEIMGRWRGSGLHTGSLLDGLLEAYGWYGKQVTGVESVHPLLFSTRSGPRPVDPAWIPLGLLRDYAGLARFRPLRTAFGGIRPLLYTNQPKARLRTVHHRGVATAMDMRGLAAPFFFVLSLDDAES